MITDLTPKNIKDIFDYDHETGLLRWKINRGRNIKLGSVTGSVNSEGYLQSTFCGKKYKTHRLIFTWVNGRWPKAEIDHANGIRTDNRISNLREVSRSENRKNLRLIKTNTSGYIGVSWNKDCHKWRATIQADNKKIHLGYFIHLSNAIQVRKTASVKYGFHKNHGSVLVGVNHDR